MDKVTKMEGFDLLTETQQKTVLNYDNNFIGLTETANKSKGAKSYQDWTHYVKENLPVNPDFRETMIAKEQILEKELQKLIDDLVGT